jgi:hypothetical protein
MGKIITPFPFSRVQKLELPELVSGLIAIVTEYNPATMHILDTFNLLLEAKPQLSRLVVVNKLHPETKVLEGLKKKRKSILQAILTQNRSLQKANLASQAEAVALIAPMLNSYWSDLNSYPNKIILERLKQMNAAIDGDATLKAAFSSLGLIVFVDELKALQLNIAKSFEKRRKANALLPRMNTREVKISVGEALSDLMEAIELACKAHPDVDYLPMATEINNFLSSYQVQMKARATRSKNAAKQSETDQTAA